MLDDQAGTDRKQILVFALGERCYGLFLSAVERVIRAVETTPLPKAPEFILGVINMQGQVIPVVDIRPCFGMARREVESDDQFILAHTRRRLVALVADSVAGIHELTGSELVTAKEILPGAAYIHGLVKVDKDLILLCDLDQFLSFDDEKKLAAALKENANCAIQKPRRKKKEAA
ncbi:MAG: purine-binding chemotaxis protein CheW [Chloroflexi bacterium]|nr:purine-binding chemotaxis protein CheW [Chloroflexota bacterium]